MKSTKRSVICTALVLGLAIAVSVLGESSAMGARRGGGARGGGRRGAGGGGNTPGNPTQPGAPTPNTPPTTRRSPEVSADLEAVKAAERDLEAAIDKIRTASMQTPEWTTAAANLNAATLAYETTRATVVTKLKADPDYQKAVADKAAAVTAMQAVASGTTSSYEADKDDTSQKVLAASMKVSKMESDALAADVDAATAHSRLLLCSEVMQQLKEQLDVSIKQSTDVQAARQRLVAAQTKLAAAVKAESPA